MRWSASIRSWFLFSEKTSLASHLGRLWYARLIVVVNLFLVFWFQCWIERLRLLGSYLRRYRLNVSLLDGALTDSF